MQHRHTPDDTPRKPAAQARAPQVVEITDATASKIFSRWTPIIRERIYRDFLRGVDPIDLRMTYRDPVFGAPKVCQIVEVIRERGRFYKREADIRKYDGLFWNGVERRRAA